MSYFSQKKQKIREQHLFTSAIFIFALFSISLLFYTHSQSICNLTDGLVFYAFIINIMFIAFSIKRKKWKALGFFLTYFFIFYTSITSHANIFINSKINSPKNISIEYTHNNKIDFGDNTQVAKSGYINLDKETRANFYTIYKYNENITFVSLDLSNVKQAKISHIMNNLTKFVLSENNPIIIIGNFGIPAWNNDFKLFLDKNSLSVKNALLFKDNKLKTDLFITPKLQVLSFDNVGINQLKFKNKKMLLTVDII